MTSSSTQLICNSFGGIRRKNSSFSADKITCSDCQNVELFYTNQNQGVGVRTTKGNIEVSHLDNKTIIGMFDCYLNGRSYLFIYAEDTTKGYLMQLYNGEVVTVKESESTGAKDVTFDKKTGKCAATYYAQGYLDMFVISNGETMKYMCVNTDPTPNTSTDSNVVTYNFDELCLYKTVKASSTVTSEIMKDTKGDNVCGLGLVNFDSRLWIFSGNCLWYSQQANCYTFNYQDPNYVTSSGYIEMGKTITAIHPYNGQLAVFFSDGFRLVTTDTTTGFGVGSEGNMGCADFNSLLAFGSDLYVYDNNKKSIYAFSQTTTGDSATTENIAEDIQDILECIDENYIGEGLIRTEAVISDDRNEIWFLLPIGDDTHSTIMIYDIKRGEWLRRYANKITSICMHNNKLYSGYNSLFQEYVGNTFGSNEEYIPSSYTCSTMLLDSFNTLKITKFPPRVVVNSSNNCNFWVKYIKNYDYVNVSKNKNVKAKASGEIAYWVEGITGEGAEYLKDSSGNYVYYKDIYGNTTTVKVPLYYKENGSVVSIDACIYTYNNKEHVTYHETVSTVKLPSSTFKSLEITFYTKDSTQGFCFKALEFTKIKVKQI